ncbi:hypothetical protein PAERUG_E15_London_28_01_14_07397 [Pseudomonas aeruginosa]|nr:hypothetical protein PAERUG_E16_London_17_VIM_2_04_14_03320 [Pseudomonas aeruginosa]CRQ99774.1 hypothetical protein PAERUG_E15_London_28_01_14_07397 [Pseudomonas aeruginosa]
MGVDFLAHFIGDGALAIDHGRAIGVQQRRVDVFMVEHQQAMVADVSAAEAELRVDREEVHAVVVHADLFGLVLGAVAGVVEEARITAADRGAPGYEGRRLVAGGHPDGIGTAAGDGFEGQAVAAFERQAAQAFRGGHLRFGGSGAGGERDAEEGEGAERRAAGQDLAAAEAGDQVVHVRVVRMVAGQLVAITEQDGIFFLQAHGRAPCGLIDGALTLTAESDGTMTGTRGLLP